ncbi:hypothetical protein [Paludibacterium yongneupense]|uniref:hypothetical protein n=1 Tax=Paludibacterium yongneupense TaxID=400061 RepID=UPI00041AB5F0|nr:hypothetical protein [Paludibacterium yongneupense]
MIRHRIWPLAIALGGNACAATLDVLGSADPPGPFGEAFAQLSRKHGITVNIFCSRRGFLFGP